MRQARAAAAGCSAVGSRPFAKAWKGSAEALDWLSRAASSGKSIPSIFLESTDKIYFMSGSSYVRCTLSTLTVDEGYPKQTADGWPGTKAPGFDRDIDAALLWNSDYVYFFKGDQCLRYNLKLNKVDDGFPLKIGRHWEGFEPAGFGSGIDAIIRWDKNRVYAFKGDLYIRFDIPTDKVDQQPKPVKPPNWETLTSIRTLRLWGGCSVTIIDKVLLEFAKKA
ncbi:hypothetical protein GO001_31690 [Streptomyces sp. NRRL B-1677]|nr:hemopexin repeat-containing protein [Streptomyces sp. NRRL B-1677]MBF6049693.1 hypothetical protein [Streptomyces sp. NRRL B-1677]